MASQWPPKKNTEFTLDFTLYKNDGTVIVDPGAITKKISKDEGAVADITAAITEEDTTYGQCSVVLSATEMNADRIWVYIKDDTSGCVPFTATLYTTAETLDEVKTDTAAILVDTGTDGVKISAGTGAGQLDFTSGVVKSNLVQILATALTETSGLIAAGFKKFFNVATPTGTVNSLPGAVPGDNGGLPTTNGTKINQTADLTAGQSIACSDKTGFSLSATGADLILKSSTFIQAIVAAVNEFATYGLTALNTLLVTTGIKTATTAAPTDMALNSTVAKDATVAKAADDFNATQKSSITAAVPTADAIGTDAASKVLVTPAQKIVTDAGGCVDANVQKVNDITLAGDGTTTPMGAA